MNLQDKVILITGASSGIGEATAKKLAKYKVKLVLAARRLENLEKIKEELDRVGGGITPAVLPHHRTYGSVYGGSCRTFEPMVLSHQRYQSKTIKELLR